ncbi:MAG: isochorismatase family cysteine hydrolase [Ligilactobacillus ruminis]|nr:isochorismatase family cysteine hydrolase [Ligilactobacillus ruminis]
MKALLVIDYTNDFIAPNGALTCGDPGRKIDDRIKKLADSFLKNGDYVIFPTDTHQKNDPYHPETKLFPPHNIKGTSGHDLYGKTAEWFNAHKDSDFVYQFDKNRYSSFQNTNLDNYLRSRGITELWLSGVCTDICVLHTAIAAYNLNYSLTIPEDAVASFDQTGHEWAMNHFKNCIGATIV